MNNIEIEHDGTCPTCQAGMYIEDNAMRCVFCDLVDASEQIAKLEADVARLQAIIQAMGGC